MIEIIGLIAVFVVVKLHLIRLEKKDYCQHCGYILSGNYCSNCLRNK